MSLRKTKNEQRKFLSRLVNLSDDADAFDAFWAAYHSWFRPSAFDMVAVWYHIAEWEDPRGDTPSASESKKMGRRRALTEIRDLMRAAWEIPDLHERRWKLNPLRDKLNRLSAPNEESLSKPPEPNPADDAIIFLSFIAHKLALCSSHGCKVERYLIGVKRIPKFCQACGDAERSVFKTEWWDERKARINAKRRREYRKAHRKNRGKVRKRRRSPAIAKRATQSTSE